MTTTATEEAWLRRYGDWYETDAQRRAAYRDYLTNLAEMQSSSPIGASTAAACTRPPHVYLGDDGLTGVQARALAAALLEHSRRG